MQVGEISLRALTELRTKSTPQVKDAAAPFEQVLMNAREIAPRDGFEQIRAMQQSILKAKEIAPQTLLSYQLAVGSFNLRVELVAKLAECASATVRKLQQNG